MEVWSVIVLIFFLVFAGVQFDSGSFLFSMCYSHVWPLLALLFHTVGLGFAASVTLRPVLPAETAASVLLEPALQINYSIPINLIRRYVATSLSPLCYSQSLC